jgi:hypothetical protein
MVAPDRKDALDIEAFDDMIASAPFAAFLARVTAELDRARGTCETASARLLVVRAQGAAQALRAVVALPARMAQEMHAKPWKASNDRVHAGRSQT